MADLGRLTTVGNRPERCIGAFNDKNLISVAGGTSPVLLAAPVRSAALIQADGYPIDRRRSAMN